MRRIAFLALVALALSACPNPSTDKPRALSALSTGGAAYYVESGAAARALEGAPAPGTLKRIESNGTTGAVVFYDSTGAVADVTTRRARKLSDGRLLLALTYAGADSCAIADPARGTLTTFSPEPSGWDFIREAGGFAYYISAGALYKGDLSTGAGVRLSDDATNSADAWIKLEADGTVLVFNPGEQFGGMGPGQRGYPAVGGTYVFTNAQYNIPTSTGLALEGMDGTIYSFGVNGSSVEYSKTGDASSQFFCALPWTHSGPIIRLSSTRLTHELTFAVHGTDGLGGLVRIVATATGLTYSATPAPAFLYGRTALTLASMITTAEAETVYHAFYETPGHYGDGYSLERFHVWRIPLSAAQARSALPDASAEIVVDQKVSALRAVGGKLFYQRDAGAGIQTMIYDGTTPRVYAEGPVSITPVQ